MWVESLFYGYYPIPTSPAALVSNIHSTPRGLNASAEVAESHSLGSEAFLDNIDLGRRDAESRGQYLVWDGGCGSKKGRSNELHAGVL